MPAFLVFANSDIEQQLRQEASRALESLRSRVAILSALSWQDRRAAISEAESSLTARVSVLKDALAQAEQARKLHEDIKQTRATLVRVRAHRTARTAMENAEEAGFDATKLQADILTCCRHGPVKRVAAVSLCTTLVC
jgi:hypothetical protein